MQTRTVPTTTHGRYLVDIPEHSRATLVGFHGYQENAAIQFDILRQIAAGRDLGLVSVQALHSFYTRANNVVASWMTKEDRELAIADNVAYVGRVLNAVADDPGITRPLIYIGFSQGAAMAYRAAAMVQRPCDGLIILAGDVPPDVVPLAGSLLVRRSARREGGPRILLGRGTEDKWYDQGKASADLSILRGAGATVAEHIFEGGHVWTPEFIARATSFIDELLS